MLRRFHDTRPEYARRLMDFSDRRGDQELWSVILQFPLYAEEYHLARCIRIADLLRDTLDVPGNVAEFGSWQGANLLFMAKLLRMFDPHGAKRTYCFESFEGLETFSPPDGVAERFRSTFQGSRQLLDDVIELFELDDEVVICQGEISETLPRVLADQPGLRFSFVYCDTDLYAPTAAILDQLHDRLNPGALVAFDEYGWDEFPGETQAVDEFLARRGADYERLHLRGSRQPTLALRRR